MVTEMQKQGFVDVAMLRTGVEQLDGARAIRTRPRGR